MIQGSPLPRTVTASNYLLLELMPTCARTRPPIPPRQSLLPTPTPRIQSWTRTPGLPTGIRFKSTLELGERGEDRATESAEDCSNGQKRTEVNYLGSWASWLDYLSLKLIDGLLAHLGTKLMVWGYFMSASDTTECLVVILPKLDEQRYKVSGYLIPTWNTTERFVVIPS